MSWFPIGVHDSLKEHGATSSRSKSKKVILFVHSSAEKSVKCLSVQDASDYSNIFYYFLN